MDTTESQVIDELFAKIRQLEGHSGPRDADAEARIREHLARQPAAPYYMAQAVVFQEQALAAAQARIEDLEQQVQHRPSGGFLSGLFGGGEPRAATPRRGIRSGVDPRIAEYANPNHPRAGGGFLAGAMQTALGVAGGVLLGQLITDMFSANTASAAEPEAAPEDDVGDYDSDFGDEDF